MFKFPYIVLQIQQLEEHLERTKDELRQMKSDLQENVELVSSFCPSCDGAHCAFSLVMSMWSFTKH